MRIDVTAADQMTSVGEVRNGFKTDYSIGIFGAGVAEIELQVTRAGYPARTVKVYATATTEDDFVTVHGPAEDVSIGVPAGGTFTSGTVSIDIVPYEENK